MDVDQAAIDAYARITDDFNPVHTDPAFAATTAMGGVIAHGTMSLNLIWQMAAQNFGSDLTQVGMKIRFVAPVRPGDRVAAGGRPSASEPGRYDVWVRNQRGENVIAGRSEEQTSELQSLMRSSYAVFCLKNKHNIM